MANNMKPLTRRIADQIEVFNKFLLRQLLRFDKLLDRLDVTELNTKCREYFGIFFESNE